MRAAHGSVRSAIVQGRRRRAAGSAQPASGGLSGGRCLNARFAAEREAHADGVAAHIRGSRGRCQDRPARLREERVQQHAAYRDRALAQQPGRPQAAGGQARAQRRGLRLALSPGGNGTARAQVGFRLKFRLGEQGLGGAGLAAWAAPARAGPGVADVVFARQAAADLASLAPAPAMPGLLPRAAVTLPGAPPVLMARAADSPLRALCSVRVRLDSQRAATAAGTQRRSTAARCSASRVPAGSEQTPSGCDHARIVLCMGVGLGC